MSRFRRPLLGAALVLLLIAGCTSSKDVAGEDDANAGALPSQAHVDEPSTDDAGALRWAALPLGGILYRTSDQQLDTWATEAQADDSERLAECLSDSGFGGSSFSDTDYRAYARVYRNRALTENEAREKGLGIAAADQFQIDNPEVETTVPGAAGSDRADTGTEAFSDAVTRCRDTFAGAQSGILRSLTDSYRAEVLADSEIDQAVDMWAACMAKRGWAVGSAAELGLLVRSSAMDPPADADYNSVTPEDIQAATERLPELEVEAALAQVACDAEAYNSVFDRWAELETRWMEAHARELKELSDFERVLLPASAMDPGIT